LISVGIITRNQADSITQTLLYLFAQSYPLKEYGEIIIADGDSSDNTRQIAENLLSQSGIRYKVINERTISDPYGVGYGHSR
jgi:glycosyltransferase involved in cell wall biosynthesis